MATDDELDDARVLASLGRIFSDGAPFTVVPGVDPETKLFPAPTVEALRAPLEAADAALSDAIDAIDETVTVQGGELVSLNTLVGSGRLSESNLAGTFVAGQAVSTDDTNDLPAPTGVGLEFVITADGLDDIRFDGVSL